MLCEQEKKRFLAHTVDETVFHSCIVEAVSSDAADEFADYCTRVLVCKGNIKPCGVCADCQKLINGSHPDITVCGAEGKPANMEAVREVISLSRIPPSEDGYRIFIFRNCEKMRWDAQNALLKLLEEPPAYIRLLLFTTKKEALLPTVRSRCRLISITDEPRESLDKTAVWAKERAKQTLDMLFDGGKRFEFLTFMTEKLTRDKAMVYLLELYQSLADILCERGQHAELASFAGRRVIGGMADAVLSARAAAEGNANLSSLFTALAVRLWGLKQ